MADVTLVTLVLNVSDEATVAVQVGTWEIPAHRVILACCSPYLFELFSTDEGGKCSEENVITYKLNGGFEKESLEHLVNYAYTGK